MVVLTTFIVKANSQAFSQLPNDCRHPPRAGAWAASARFGMFVEQEFMGVLKRFAQPLTPVGIEP
jgi:hypothetical protein